MRRSLTISSVLACLVFSAATLLPLEPWAKSRATTYAFEIWEESDQSGLVQLYYDVGRGVNETDSALQPIEAGHPSLLRFPLPSGRYVALRFDLLDRDARITLSGARIIDGSGRTLRSFGPDEILAWYQIQSRVVRDGKLFVETTPHAGDPQLEIKLQSPLTIPRPSLWKEFGEVFAGMIGCLLLVGWARSSARVRLDDRVRSLWRAACASPARALAAVALAGTIAANYPIVFAGKSFVSPSFDAALLYGQSPWLPGLQSVEVGDPHKADIGAVIWHHLPLSMIQRKALFQEGELPLWNRYDSAGVPLLGQGQSCFGDPLHIIPILANGAAWAWDLKLLLAKWVFALGVGLCAWRAFRHLPSALLVALSASYMGFYVYRINHPALFGICYSPWILYCWLRCMDGRSMRSAIIWMTALIGANWTEMNSGTAKEAYILLLSMNFSGLCALLACGRPWREKLRLLCGLAAAGVLFTLLGTPVWYTFYRALKGAYTSYNLPLAFQIQPGMMIGLFDEAFYRPFQLDFGVVNPAANFFVLLGVLWAMVRWRALLANRPALGLALSCLPALALVFGVISPGLITRVPFLGNILHIDNTFSCALIVIFTVLSGFGWKEAWQRLGSEEGKRDGAVVMVLVFVLFAAFLGTVQSIVRSAYFAWTWGKMIQVDPLVHVYGWSLVIASAALLWALHRALLRGSPTPAVLIWAVLGFSALHWREALQTRAGFSNYVVRPTERMDFHAPSPAVDAMLARRDEPSRAIGFHNDLFPGWSIVYGLEGISGPDALVNRYYRELMDTAGVNRIWDWRYIVEPGEVAKLRYIFDMANVRFYAGYHMGEQRPGQELRQIISLDMDAYESLSPWPRAFFTDSAAVYNDLPQFCSWLKFGDGRPFVGIERSDWVKLSPVPSVSGDLTTREVRPAENYKLTNNTTSFTVWATGPGFIVLTEAYERDNFHVTLNGKGVPYLRVNHAFKGIYVDKAGAYAVRFEYWPRGLTTSLILAAAALALIVLALLAAAFALKREPAESPNGSPAPS